MIRSALTLSSVFLASTLAVSALAIAVLTTFGDDLSEVLRSIFMRPHPDEILPRLVIGALVLWGVYLIVRQSPARMLTLVALACGATGLIACIAMIIYGEITAFQNGSGGSLRVHWMPSFYLSALVQAMIGFCASTLLLAIRSVRRPPSAP